MTTNTHYIAGALRIPGTNLDANVTGCCSHKHRSAEAAQACIDDHDRRIKRGHGRYAYSDRVVVMVTDGIRCEVQA